MESVCPLTRREVGGRLRETRLWVAAATAGGRSWRQRRCDEETLLLLWCLLELELERSGRSCYRCGFLQVWPAVVDGDELPLRGGEGSVSWAQGATACLWAQPPLGGATGSAGGRRRCFTERGRRCWKKKKPEGKGEWPVSVFGGEDDGEENGAGLREEEDAGTGWRGRRKMKA
uniref:Uncharacterized protein n=1 Tax=Populus trichocarpa TaxID=3694 RepID=A0A2K1XJI1_POPTR